MQYTDLKNCGTEKLLETLSDMLEKYQQRLENIESYVYMQCVGIQLEKHFSQQRAESLAGKILGTSVSCSTHGPECSDRSVSLNITPFLPPLQLSKRRRTLLKL